jgi:Endonuclease-reverse transcriptase
LGDFNAYSPIWNPLITRLTDITSLEAIINRFDLIFNNEPGIITRTNLTRNKSIIDLTFTTTDIELLDSWAIKEENPTLLNHELIVFSWNDLRQNRLNKRPKEITGWNIDKLLLDQEKQK